MRRRYKLLAVLIALPAVLVLGAAIVLPILADSRHYRREVIALVQEHSYTMRFEFRGLKRDRTDLQL